jgi:sigma-B regulation protein RsbU (phosphoserine phosphatase)
MSLDEIGGPPLGVFDGLEYDQVIVNLEPDDVLAFYTDGITEAMNDESRQFGTGRLDDVLARCELNANDMIWAVVEAVDQFTGGQPPLDDRTLLVMQISDPNA